MIIKKGSIMDKRFAKFSYAIYFFVCFMFAYPVFAQNTSQESTASSSQSAVSTSGPVSQPPATSQSQQSQPQQIPQSQQAPEPSQLQQVSQPQQTSQPQQPTQPQMQLSRISSTSPNKISLDIKGMDIVDVLKMLASKTNMNLVIDKNVTGRATVFLKDVSPKEALETILVSNDLVPKKEGEITRIMTTQAYEQLYGCQYSDTREKLRIKLKYARPQDVAVVLNQFKSHIGRIVADEASGAVILFDTKKNNEEIAKFIEEMDMPLETGFFEVNYAKGEKIAEMLQDMTTKGVGSVKWDSRSSQLMVTDYPLKLKKIKEAILAFDERTKEISLEAKIVQVALNDQTSLGVDWEYVLNKKMDVKSMFVDSFISTTGNTWTIGKSNPQHHNDYSAIIVALQSVGKTKVLSSPTLTVVNNEEASILVGSKQVYVTTTAVQGQTTTETAEAVNFVDVGVKLHVTPMITHDGFISLKIKPEVSSATQSYTTSTGNKIPIVETSEATTTVLIENGQTIMIGGLMKDEKINNSDSIPWISKIPLIGFFFRNTVDSRNKTELAIFLTCKILDLKSPSPVS